jgi:hypothetical protein
VLDGQEITGQYVADIDECAENVDPPCDSNQECINTQGSFQCICQTGFQLDPLLHACVGKIFFGFNILKAYTFLLEP